MFVVVEEAVFLLLTSSPVHNVKQRSVRAGGFWASPGREVITTDVGSENAGTSSPPDDVVSDSRQAGASRALPQPS